MPCKHDHIVREFEIPGTLDNEITAEQRDRYLAAAGETATRKAQWTMREIPLCPETGELLELRWNRDKTIRFWCVHHDDVPKATVAGAGQLLCAEVAAPSMRRPDTDHRIDRRESMPWGDDLARIAEVKVRKAVYERCRYDTHEGCHPTTGIFTGENGDWLFFQCCESIINEGIGETAIAKAHIVSVGLAVRE